MFKFAQEVVRHKVGVVAVLSFAVFVFSGRPAEEQKPVSPWASQKAVARAEDSFSTKLGHAATTAGDFVAEKALGDKDLNPIRLGKESAGRFEQTNDAMKAANGN